MFENTCLIYGCVGVQPSKKTSSLDTSIVRGKKNFPPFLIFQRIYALFNDKVDWDKINILCQCCESYEQYSACFEKFNKEHDDPSKHKNDIIDVIQILLSATDISSDIKRLRISSRKSFYLAPVSIFNKNIRMSLLTEKKRDKIMSWEDVFEGYVNFKLPVSLELWNSYRFRLAHCILMFIHSLSLDMYIFKDRIYNDLGKNLIPYLKQCTPNVVGDNPERCCKRCASIWKSVLFYPNNLSYLSVHHFEKTHGTMEIVIDAFAGNDGVKSGNIKSAISLSKKKDQGKDDESKEEEYEGFPEFDWQDLNREYESLHPC